MQQLLHQPRREQANSVLERLLEGFQGKGASSTVSRFPLSSPHRFYQPVFNSSIHGDMQVV